MPVVVRIAAAGRVVAAAPRRLAAALGCARMRRLLRMEGTRPPSLPWYFGLAGEGEGRRIFQPTNGDNTMTFDDAGDAHEGAPRSPADYILAAFCIEMDLPPLPVGPPGARCSVMCMNESELGARRVRACTNHCLRGRILKPCPHPARPRMIPPLLLAAALENDRESSFLRSLASAPPVLRGGGIRVHLLRRRSSQA